MASRLLGVPIYELDLSFDLSFDLSLDDLSKAEEFLL